MTHPDIMLIYPLFDKVFFTEPVGLCMLAAYLKLYGLTAQVYDGFLQGESLDTVAKQQKIPRDFLVEISIERLLPVITAEQEKHQKRKLIYKDLQDYLFQGQKLLRKTERVLGKDDRVSAKLRKIVAAYEANVTELADRIESGRIMEDFSAG